MKYLSEVKVRFNETDALAHVNNTSYFIYLEQARIELLEHIGAGASISDWRYVLAHTSCDFINQAFFNDTLIVESNVSHIGNSSFHLSHTIFRKEDDALIAKGKAVLINFNFKTQRSETIPSDIKEELTRYQLEDEKENIEQR